jgi:hypothetical protein
LLLAPFLARGLAGVWAFTGVAGHAQNATSPVAVVEGLPDAPEPQTSDAQDTVSEPPALMAWQQSMALPGQAGQSTTPGFPPVSPQPRKRPSGSGRQHPSIPSEVTACLPDTSMAHPPPMSCVSFADPYERFLNSTDIHPLTPKQKALLAYRNETDPFNLLTIGFLSGFSVAADSHSPYGPGWPGFGRSVGVAYTETVVGEFFGTFLIPSLVHQDPHYHREPNASVTHRTLHAIASVVWAQSDTGQGMPNYANLGTTAIGITLGDLYVPGAEQGFGAGVERYVTAIASDPISNIVTEFLPDVARRINVRIVVVQRIVNEVERQNGAG